ncbi:class I SAM-dependent methyltransferase [Ruminococcus albus]|uniref:Methyltransferase domain-containing protein n=1 Tax=Ruminococcus albus TaxID=1264 RepID=A0A1H7GMX1_RUMAL|nr:SAM-dependent methyltransferase [Ruminococcus albus]SEK39419.1 Methyltransferase domain-containing protein [Ruminococcus albus]
MFLEYAVKLKNAMNRRKEENEHYAAVRQFINAPAGGKLLDIGLGSDVMLQKLSDKGLDLYGVDISASDRERSIDEIALMGQANIEELPYFDNFFDCVTTLHTPPLWENKTAALKEILRVLKEGGRFVCLFTFDSDTGLGTPPRSLRETVRQAGFEKVAVKILRSDGSYLLTGEKPC